MAIDGLSPPPPLEDSKFKDWLFRFYQAAVGSSVVSGYLQVASNLSDLNSASAARTNLGLGGLATVTPGTGVATFLATPSSANLAAAVTGETGSGALVFATSPTLTTPNIGTPSAGTLTSCTGLPISTGVSGLAAGIATFLATPSSANLRAALTDETGTGAAVFAGGNIGDATATSLASSGAITSSGATDGIGYAAGSGGSATQLTSKSNAVTVNKACGRITMNNAALAAGAKVTFNINCSAVSATTDGAIVWVATGGTADAYRANVTRCAAGVIHVTVENITAGSLSESPVIGFALIKSVNS